MEQLTLKSGLKIGVEEKGAIVLGHTDSQLKVLTIPFEIEHNEQRIKVVEIAPKVFSKCELEEVNIPSTIKLIGESAFFHCENLKKINFLDNENEYKSRWMFLEMGFRGFQGLEIGSLAFSHCDSLTEVHIPMYVWELNDEAFSHCSSLEKVVWDELDKGEIIITGCYCERPRYSVSIGKRAFYCCEKLTELQLSPLVGSLGESFIAHTAIPKMDLLEGKMEIEDFAFAFSNLETIVFPEQCYNIRYGTCARCYKLKDVVLPSRLEYIDEDAFSCCTSLSDIYIPRSVKEIDPRSFKGCSNLWRVSCSKKHIPVLKKQLPADAVYEV